MVAGAQCWRHRFLWGYPSSEILLFFSLSDYSLGAPKSSLHVAGIKRNSRIPEKQQNSRYLLHELPLGAALLLHLWVLMKTSPPNCSEFKKLSFLGFFFFHVLNADLLFAFMANTDFFNLRALILNTRPAKCSIPGASLHSLLNLNLNLN